MTIVPEATDELQLLNCRRVLKRAIRECIRRWKTDAVGATWHGAVAGRGDRHSDGSVCLGSVFGIFLLYCLALVSSPPAFIVYAGSSSVFLLLSR